jgi:hypothetical protein
VRPLLLLTMCLLATPAALAQGPVVALRAPDAHGRAFDLESLRGNVVAVTFVSRYTQDEAARINDALGARGGDVKVVSVVDFIGIPGFVHNYARRKMAEADGRVQHLCDEHGDLRRRFGAHSDKHVDIFIVDRDGGLRGRFEGQRQLEAALRLIDEVRTSTAQR